MTSTQTQLQFAPYLPTSRNFEGGEGKIALTMNKAYFEIANAVNLRTIGTYDKFSAATGNRYFNTGDPTNRLQSFRQAYTLSALPNTATATIPTTIDFTSNKNTTFVNSDGVVENGPYSIPMTPWIIGAPNDAPYLRVNRSTGNIEVITTTANWVGYNAKIFLEYILIG